MPIFKDKVGISRKISIGPLSGTATVPSLTRKTSKVKSQQIYNENRTSTREISRFMQGSENQGNINLRSGLLPIIRSKREIEIYDPREGTISSFDFSIEETAFGQPKLFRDDTLFVDISNMKGHQKIVSSVTSAYGGPVAYLENNGTEMYPLVLAIPNYKDPDQRDGVIEPFPLRDSFYNTSIELPFHARGIKAILIDGNASSERGADLIVQSISLEGGKFDKFVDSQEVSFITVASGAISLPGISEQDNSGFIAPFNDSRRSRHHLASRAPLHVLTKSLRDRGVSDYASRPAPGGFTYRNNEHGTDTVAFGGDLSNGRAGGFLNLPPKIYLRSFDTKPGSYPENIRSGDPDNRGRPVSGSFDDTNTVIFSNSQEVVYPYMLPTGSKYIRAEGRYKDVLSSPIIAIATASLGRVHIEKTVNTRINPFNDSRIEIRDTSFYLTGTSTEIMPGFSSPLKNKIQISLDITPSQNSDIFRFTSKTQSRTAEDGVAGSRFENKQGTGFAYFNFNLKRWEQIGITDPVTGENTESEFLFSNKLGQGGISSGSVISQFTASPHVAFRFSSEQDALKTGYHKIGLPTILGMAPNKPIYYATGSQVIKVRDLGIHHPFVLEKVVADVSVEAHRSHGRGSPAHASLKSAGANRDIDNHVVFIYRQRKESEGNRHGNLVSGNPVSALRNTVSGSRRYLVCSASMAFVNTPTASGSKSSGDINLFNRHSPSFIYDFNMPVSGVAGRNKIGAFSGSVHLEMIPAITNRQFTTISEIPAWPRASGDTTVTTGSLSFQNFWPGGSYLPTSLSESYARQSASTSPSIAYFLRYPPSASYYIPPNSNALTRNDDWNDPISIDPRSFRKPVSSKKINSFSPFTGNHGRHAYGEKDTQIVHVTDVKNCVESPYLLMPDDEIIIGIEAGITVPRIPTGSLTIDTSGYSDSLLTITGSSLTMKSSPSSITLFGSLIRAGVEDNNSFSLSQDLTTNQIHEAIYGRDNLGDQFDIEETRYLIGSYVSENFAGSLIDDGDRPIDTSLNVNNYGDQASVQRNIKIVSDSERYYDTLMPSTRDFGVRAGATYDGSLPHERGRPGIVFTSTELVLERERPVYPFPYVGNPQRIVGADRTVVQDGPTTVSSNYETTKKILFMVGYQNISTGLGVVSHATGALGAHGTRYGIRNISPERTYSIFRRDRYGNFSDMLEQRTDGKFFLDGSTIAESPVVCRFVDSLGNDVDPLATNSLNISHECTSSIPFIDGKSLNRGSSPEPGSLTRVVNSSEVVSSRTLEKAAGTSRGDLVLGAKRNLRDIIKKGK